MRPRSYISFQAKLQHFVKELSGFGCIPVHKFNKQFINTIFDVEKCIDVCRDKMK